MFRLSIRLFIIAFVCALILGFIFQKTEPIIEKQKQILLERSLQAVLEANYYQVQKEMPIYYTAYDENKNVLGWCLPVTSRGYGGKMQLLVGLNTKHEITGIKILEHRETPGLGSKINDAEYKQAEPAFLKQFKNKKAEELILVKQKTDKNIQAITGATISSKAVTDGVRKVAEEFLKTKIKP